MREERRGKRSEVCAEEDGEARLFFYTTLRKILAARALLRFLGCSFLGAEGGALAKWKEGV